MKFSSKHLAAFYYQLGTMVEAGVSLEAALTTLSKSAPRPLGATVAELREGITRGEPLSEAMARLPRRFAAMDQRTIAISERTGTLDIGLQSLSKFHEARTTARRQIVSASILPGVILVAAVFISHVPALVVGMLGNGDYSTNDYLRDTVWFLVLVAVAGAAIFWLVKFLLTLPGWDAVMERIIGALPLFGRLRFDYALSQWLAAIRLLLKAGYGIIEALDHAGASSSNPNLAHAVERARPLINSQLTVSQALQSTGVFPVMLIQFWATGEQSGKMDEMLDRLVRVYDEQWQRSLDQLATWLPRIVYALVSVYVILQIVKLLGPVVGAYRDALQL